MVDLTRNIYKKNTRKEKDESDYISARVLNQISILVHRSVFEEIIIYRYIHFNNQLSNKRKSFYIVAHDRHHALVFSRKNQYRTMNYVRQIFTSEWTLRWDNRCEIIFPFLHSSSQVIFSKLCTYTLESSFFFFFFFSNKIISNDSNEHYYHIDKIVLFFYQCWNKLGIWNNIGIVFSSKKFFTFNI